MANSQFLRFFDTSGNDMNLGSAVNIATPLISEIQGTTSGQVNLFGYTGTLFFPKVSVNLIESQQIFLLQNVTDTVDYTLRSVTGEVTVISGNPSIVGIGTEFTQLIPGQKLSINDNIVTISYITDDNNLTLTSSISESFTTTNIYSLDYVSLSELRSSPRTYAEYINVSFDSENTNYFLYSIDYTDTVPYIQKLSSTSYQLVDGSNDSIDPLTGRIVLNSIITEPLQINIALGATSEDIFQDTLVIQSEKHYTESLIAAPIFSGNNVIFTIGGTTCQQDIYDFSVFSIQGVTASGATSAFYEQGLTVTNITTDGTNTFITIDDTSELSNASYIVSSYSSYRLLWVNTEVVSLVSLYGETEEEDERLKIVLANFGKKIDHENEYIFRDSDINEDLTDYVLLNNKRKELLLEGDNIFPYLGSYKALINILNYFGYNDVAIKEYFLNVDSTSVNYGKYFHLLIPKDSTQRALVSKAWDHFPSKVYKKTSLFGLFYNLNELSGQVDEYGIPEVIDSFQFTPEEVLIKLFGLKELLKQSYLPLNAKIYDITGEGIYFERVRIDTWSDTLNHTVLNIGDNAPIFNVYPATETFITDLRRIDQFYIDVFTTQGLTGFLGATSNFSNMTGLSSTLPIGTYANDYLGSFDNFENETYTTFYDNAWDDVPPGVYNPNFNTIAGTLKPLPDHHDIPAGGPILLEAIFELTWDDGTFSWNDLSVLGVGGDPMNIDIWTWNTLGQGQYHEMRWTAQQNGSPGYFFDSGRLSIDDFTVDPLGDGVTRILYAMALPNQGNYRLALYVYDITNNFNVQYQNYTVLSKNVDFSLAYRTETSERTWNDFSVPVHQISTGGTITLADSHILNWDDVTGPWYYPIHVESAWEDAKISWEDLGFDKYKDQSVFEYSINSNLMYIDRVNEYILMSGNITANLPNQILLSPNDYVFFSRQANNFITADAIIPVDSFSPYVIGTTGTAVLSFVTGSTSVSTGTNNLTGIISIGDTISKGDSIWYNVTGISPTTISIDSAAVGTTSSYIVTVPSTGILTFNYTLTGTVSPINTYSRVLISSNTYSTIIPGSTIYDFFNGLTQSGTGVTIQGDVSMLQSLISLNSSNGLHTTLKTSWGVFSGDYAIKITSIGVTGNNTIIRLDDVNKYLYNIDGSFTMRLADYDVNYAESRIGIDSLHYENLDETTWEELSTSSWKGLEYHSGALCGFTIPFVSPGGSIAINENDTFVFSGNPSIGSTQGGLRVAAAELNSSDNAGISMFNYEVSPVDPIFMLTSTGATLSVGAHANSGDTSIILSGGLPISTSSKIWTGREWIKMNGSTGSSTILLTSPLTYPIEIGTCLLLPYNYHNQIVDNPTIFQQYYFFIYASAKNPSSDNLAYIYLSNGVESEWLQHPDRTYSYALNNTIENNFLYKNVKSTLYNQWIYEGADYPPLLTNSDYASDELSIQSRIPFSQAVESAYSFIDTVISDSQQNISVCTPVIFQYSNCKVPGKKNPLWTITDNVTGIIQVMSTASKLMWNFTKTGNYSVQLQLQDALNNNLVGQKISLITVS